MSPDFCLSLESFPWLVTVSDSDQLIGSKKTANVEGLGKAVHLRGFSSSTASSTWHKEGKTALQKWTNP